MTAAKKPMPKPMKPWKGWCRISMTTGRPESVERSRGGYPKCTCCRLARVLVTEVPQKAKP